MKIEKLKQVIEAVNNELWYEYAPYFDNNLELFMSIAIKNGLSDEFDPMGLVYQNMMLWCLIKNEPKKWTDYICEKILNNDLTKVGEDWYLELSDLTDLSELFYHGNRDSTKNVVQNVLGENSWDPYWDTTDDIYSDVIEELDEKNTGLLIDALLKELDGVDVETRTDYLDELDLNDTGVVKITKDNFLGMFEDERTLKFLLKNYADGINSELFHMHGNCYNSSYESELYESTWDELSKFFEGKPEWKSQISTFDPKKTRYTVFIKIRDIIGDISKYLFESKNSQYNQDTLEYLGSYTEMLKNGMNEGIWETLDFRIPDYPDSTKVDECINENFTEYF